MNLETPQERSYWAAQWVLGLLDAAERAEVQASIRDQISWDRELAFWEERFHGLAESLEPEEVPRRVWNKVEYDIDAAGATGGLIREFIQSVRFWRPLAIVASAVALILFFYARQPVTPPQTPPPMVALLGEPEQAPHYMVAVEPMSHRMMIKTMGEVQAPPGKAMVLWILPGGDKAPVNCGVMPETGAKDWIMKPKEIEAMHGGKGLAVTLEPMDNTATETPTGPIVYQGQFASL